MAEFGILDQGGSEAEFRQALAYFFAQESTGLAATGVIAGLAVSQTTTASGSVLIAAGMGVSQDSVLHGVAPLVNNTTKTLDVLTDNPADSNPRNDIVVFDSDSNEIEVVTGTPNAVPTDPTVPDTAIPLARLRIAGSATTIPSANIDDLREFTRLAQGIRAQRSFYRSSTTSVSTSSELGLTSGWAADSVDGTGASGITSPASGVLTVSKSGVYQITVSTYWGAGTAGGTRIVNVRKNGNNGATSSPTGDIVVRKLEAGTGSAQQVEVTRDVRLAAEDTLQVWVFQSSGADVDLAASAAQSYWQVARVAD